MLLCYLNVKQNVRVMAESECTIKTKLLLTGEGKKYSNIQNKQKYLYSCLSNVIISNIKNKTQNLKIHILYKYIPKVPKICGV